MIYRPIHIPNVLVGTSSLPARCDLITAMDLRDIRRLIITALFSDDELMEKFVLKGGNALDLVHELGARSSVDIDLSIPDDFSDPDDVKERIFRALRDRFDSAGYVVFDEKFGKKPSRPRKGQSPRWGGYMAEFKITTKEHFDKHKDDLGLLQRSAQLIGAEQRRVFKIDISKFEFTATKLETELDDFTIYVYTLPMLAIEKLRAICQQMPEYPLRPYSKPRARDFYDIHAVVSADAIDLTTEENIELLRNIFAAKEVPLPLLGEIKKTRDFHVVDWPAVEQSVSGPLEEFDFYFSFVLEQVERLKNVGII
jgi:predicted nucleotidyltransferase component of viral defense system